MMNYNINYAPLRDFDGGESGWQRYAKTKKYPDYGKQARQALNRES